MSARQQVILDAAIAVLGRDGPRGLTHRATDREAGLAEGSTANLFGRRRELLDAITERMRQIDRERWESLSGHEPQTARELAEALMDLVGAGIGPATAETVRARLFLHLDAPEAIAADNRSVTAAIAEQMAAVGADPDSVELLLSTIDGLALRAVTFGAGSLPPRPVILDVLLRIMRADVGNRDEESTSS